jgi:hypothetical protein
MESVIWLPDSNGEGPIALYAWLISHKALKGSMGW